MIANTDYKRELAALRTEKELVSKEICTLLDKKVIDALTIRLLKKRSSALEERIAMLSNKAFDDIIA